MTKKNCLIRVNEDTRDLLKIQKREIETIENKDIALGDLVERMAKGVDIFPRLKMGAMERRKSP